MKKLILFCGSRRVEEQCLSKEHPAAASLRNAMILLSLYFDFFITKSSFHHLAYDYTRTLHLTMCNYSGYLPIVSLFVTPFVSFFHKSLYTKLGATGLELATS